MPALGFPHWLSVGVIAEILEFIPIAGWMMAATTIAGFGISHALTLDLDARIAGSLADKYGLRDLSTSHGTSTGDVSTAGNSHGHGGGAVGGIAGILSCLAANCLGQLICPF